MQQLCILNIFLIMQYDLNMHAALSIFQLKLELHKMFFFSGL